MKPAPFIYHSPRTLDEALELLGEYGDEAKPLAGGQSLVPAMNFRLSQPAVLVDLNPIASLSGIQPREDGSLLIGAMERQRSVERIPVLAEKVPLVAEAMPHIAHPQIRNRGTFGGSLAHADPAAELPAIAVALDMQLHARGTGSDRWIDARDFFPGLFETALAPGELLVEIAIPPLLPRTGYAFEEVARRHGDYALAGAAAVVSLNEQGVVSKARLVFFAIDIAPVEAVSACALLQGETPTATVLRAAADAVLHDIDPLGDIHATAAYRRHLATVLASRTLARAVDRARSRSGGEA
jgi:aerobic carbon-monoxide dehydrogenase medium subunit